MVLYVKFEHLGLSQNPNFKSYCPFYCPLSARLANSLTEMPYVGGTPFNKLSLTSPDGSHEGALHAIIQSPGIASMESDTGGSANSPWQNLSIACGDFQRTLPISLIQNPEGLKVADNICVRFPLQQDTLSRLDAICPRGEEQQLGPIRLRYWEACQRIQQDLRSHYRTFCNKAVSLERFGGRSDFELQLQLAEGFSRWYESQEIKLAEVILARFATRLPARNPSVNQIETVSVQFYLMLYESTLLNLWPEARRQTYPPPCLSRQFFPDRRRTRLPCSANWHDL